MKMQPVRSISGHYHIYFMSVIRGRLMMPMKYVAFDSCWNCQFAQITLSNNNPGYYFRCRNNDWKTTPEDGSIPDWCNLPELT